MGLIKAAVNAAGGVLADQWKEYFYAESLSNDVLVTKGMKQMSARFGGSKKASDNVISNGSAIAVNEGQAMIIVDDGKVAEFSAEPGVFIYDESSEPSIFTGPLSETIKATFANIGRRFTYGGEPGKDQRVYFFNTKEIVGNKYGTPNPVPFRVIDQNIGLDIDIAIRCHGEYSIRITDPLLFYTSVSGNVQKDYDRDELEGQLKSELMTALQPAFARISEMGIRYSALPGHAQELADALNQVLSEKWGDMRGLAIVSFGVSSVTASEEDEKMIKELQRNAVLRNPNMAAAHLVGAQAEAMQSAAKNESAGPVMGFAGMNMAQQAGGANAASLFAMGAQQQQAATQSQQQAQAGWSCACGQGGNTGKFCGECGQPQPGGIRCDKCGWTAAPGDKAPKFCPECGDPVDENDRI